MSVAISVPAQITILLNYGRGELRISYPSEFPAHATINKPDEYVTGVMNILVDSLVYTIEYIKDTMESDAALALGPSMQGHLIMLDAHHLVFFINTQTLFYLSTLHSPSTNMDCCHEKLK
ncbi:hypothetical protein FQN53_005085 [Emmonsiellopsis sp. PD_33]|nr:hypothetical protein FQN53_005085 [Emmonsiellopsis sp. PD_33]KAK2783415.1 hypothetical protein FQN51_004339 [Onygenales sp. PD_10]